MFEVTGLEDLGDGSATLVLSYPDANQDGIVDGTGYAEYALTVIATLQPDGDLVAVEATHDILANTFTVHVDSAFIDALNADAGFTIGIGYNIIQACDVDRDGEITAIDIQAITNAALGLPSPFHTNADGNDDTNAIDLQFAINAALGMYELEVLQIPTR
jgi:hypothetical protein